MRDTDRASLAKEDQLHSQVSKGKQQTQLEVQIRKSTDHEALRAVSIVYTASVSQQAKLTVKLCKKGSWPLILHLYMFPHS